jgi:hypothetical protein
MLLPSASVATPSPLLLLLGAAAVGALVLAAPRLLSRAQGSLRIFQRLRDLRASRHVDMAVISAYHERLPDADRTGALDDRTWKDLDLDDVFQSLDHAASEPGRQYLYHLLRTPTISVGCLERLEHVVGRLAADDDVATRLRATIG